MKQDSPKLWWALLEIVTMCERRSCLQCCCLGVCAVYIYFRRSSCIEMASVRTVYVCTPKCRNAFKQPNSNPNSSSNLIVIGYFLLLCIICTARVILYATKCMCFVCLCFHKSIVYSIFVTRSPNSTEIVRHEYFFMIWWWKKKTHRRIHSTAMLRFWFDKIAKKNRTLG